MRILMARPSLSALELKAVESVFETGWLGEGQLTAAFEDELCRFTGAPHAIAVNTGTSALHLSLHSRGIGSGDEVIMPAFTFVSDAMAVHTCGAKPVYGDIDPDTLNLDPQQIEPLITDRTRAILPTDYAGLPSDIKAMKDVVGSRNILLIRDASHSFGSQKEGCVIGLNHGEDATCFSFDPIKNITCGEGGAILVGSKGWAEDLIAMKNLGLSNNFSKKRNGRNVAEKQVVTSGFRYHMPNLNASIGLAQLQRLPTLIQKKCRLAQIYDKELRDVSGVRTFNRNYDEVIPFIYPILVDMKLRDELVEYLIKKGIHAGVRYTPCHHQSFFKTKEPTHLPETERIFRELVCLPIYADLPEQAVYEVIDHIRTFMISKTEGCL